MTRDKAAEQLKEYAESHKESGTLVTGTGAPIDDKLNVMTVGARGPLLMQDFAFTDEMAHFNRERIPERVVHAKGAGAKGYFEVTHDVTKYCKASIFDQIGKKTPLAVRFSTVGGESGSADTARDPRGFAVKFYTDEGNWDLVGNNTPIFFIRDAIFFPSFIHSQKRNPQTHLKDPDAFWDFISLRPETTHQVAFLFSDRGVPDGYRHMNGYGSNTFKLVNEDDEAVYCKFHYKTDQGIKNLFADEADRLGGLDPDYAIRDLYNAIAEKNYPSWTMYIQRPNNVWGGCLTRRPFMVTSQSPVSVMTFEQAENYRWNPFDVTKIWSHAEFPLIPVGKMVLNENPSNYFADVEQIAFSPSHLVPGIEPSPDKMLQGRIFSYPDTQRHRLGGNYLQLPINCPYRVNKVTNYQRDGPQCLNDNCGGAPNYYPNSFNGPIDGNMQGGKAQRHIRQHPQRVSGDCAKFNSANEDDYSQVTDFWNNVLKADERERMAQNIGLNLKDAQPFLQKRVLENFAKVHPKLSEMIQKAMDKAAADEA